MDLRQMIEDGQMIALVQEEWFANVMSLDAQRASEDLEKRIEDLHWIWKE